MSEKQCKSCQHFRQHYTFDSRRIFRVYCGHCVCSKVKRKAPDAKACENFVPGATQEDAFATKEYLSKELVQYLTSLELLPDVKDEE